jgi:GT2 family glycosyltransferase
MDGDDAVTREEGRGVREREHPAPSGYHRQSGLLEEVVAGPTGRGPDVAVDARIIDTPGSHDPKLEPGFEPGGLRGVEQGTTHAVKTGGPGTQEAPIDDDHAAIVAVRETPVNTVSVVVPVRNGARTLPACLDALGRQEPIADVTVEVIVVDNGSTDASREIARKHPAVTRVVTEPRTGSYAARNAGLAVAAGDLIAFTDADCIPAPDWLRRGIDEVCRGLDLVAGHVSPRVREEPSLWERFDAGHHVDQRKYVEILGFGATANLFVRRHVLDGVGMFDAAMASGGDLELCRRAVAAGFELAYAPYAVVTHGTRRTALETWRLHRRLGAGLRQLHRRGLHPSWWRDDQMVLPLGWAAEVASDETRRYRQREMVPLAAVVVGARVVGRLTGR